MERKLARPGFWMATLLVLLVLGIQVILGVLVGVADVVCERVLNRPSPALEQHPLVLGGINVVAFLVAIALGLYLNRLPFSRAFPPSRITFRQLAGLTVIVFGAGLVSSGIEDMIVFLMPPPRWLVNLLAFRSSLVLRVILLVIIAPVTEETLFRGIILRGLLGRHRPATAVALTSLLFAAVHMNPWQTFSAFFLGILFGWVYLRTGSLMLCMLAHAMYNGTGVIFSLVPWHIPGLTGTPDPLLAEFQPWWVDLCGAGILLAGIWMFHRATPPELATPESTPPPLPPSLPACEA